MKKVIKAFITVAIATVITTALISPALRAAEQPITEPLPPYGTTGWHNAVYPIYVEHLWRLANEDSPILNATAVQKISQRPNLSANLYVLVDHWYESGGSNQFELIMLEEINRMRGLVNLPERELSTALSFYSRIHLHNQIDNVATGGNRQLSTDFLVRHYQNLVSTGIWPDSITDISDILNPIEAIHTKQIF